jgi:hypothetical protein
MTLTLDQKRFVFGIGGGLLLFWAMKEFLFKPNAPEIKSEPATADEVQQALLAYETAINKGEDSDALAELNDMLEEEFAVRVYKISDGSLVAKDLTGKQVGTL